MAFARPVISLLKRAYSRFNAENVLTISSGMAFNTLLCLIPFLVVITSLLGVFLQSAYANQRLDEILGSVFPSEVYAKEIKKFIYKLISDIVHNRRQFGIAGLGTLLWTAASLFGFTRRIMNGIYHIEKSKSFLRKLIENVLLIAILGFLFLIANVFTWVLRFAQSSLSELLTDQAIDFKIISKSFPVITSYVSAFAMFYIINRYMPDKKIPAKIALIASLTTTSLWWVAGKLFAWYVATFHPFSQIYGTYAFIFIFILWVYYSSMVFVIGLIVAQVFRERHAAIDATKAFSSQRPIRNYIRP